jgi:uncharacterized repeat protein (TIGR03803 family)
MKNCIKTLRLPLALITGLCLLMSGRLTAQTFTTLHTFAGESDGAAPLTGLTLSGNTLYGTASAGGNLNFMTPGGGTIFAVQTDGLGFTNFFEFALPVSDTNSTGANPSGNLLLSGNTLYGTARQGGTNGFGTIFRINTDGLDFTNLYTFTNGTDGSGPVGGLSLSGNTLYGAASGGTGGRGSVFAIKTDGTGFTNIYYLTGAPIAMNPAGLILSGNTLYGTTFSYPYNTIFSVNTDGSGFTNIYSVFNGGSYGSSVIAGLILSGNTLYGTAEYGGASTGYGSVFAVNTDSSGFTNLYIFPADGGYNSFNYYTNSEGVYPTGLTLSSNTLYVTTYEGGALGYGVVFAVSTNGTSFTNLFNFNYTPNGTFMSANPIVSGKTLYGTAPDGGLGDHGSVFSFTLGIVPLVVTTTSLPNGTTNIAYSQTLEASGGQTPYTWTNISGTLPKGLNLAASGLLSGTPTTNGTFNFTVKVTDAMSMTATQALALLINIVDKTPPTLSITNITTGMTVSNAAFTVKGTAKDNVAVSNVLVSLNNGPWAGAAPVNGWSNWSAQVTLIPGTNTIAAYAVDTSGNDSLATTDKLAYVVTTTLTVRTNGDGGISPVYNGAPLQVGTSYSMTATAKTGSVFTNWTDGLGNIITNGATLKFVMESNLTFVANLVETAKPSLTITTPTNLQKMTNALAAVKGTASDAWQVSKVWYQLNNGAWSLPSTTNGWTNWNVTLPLILGTNKLNAYAMDLGGNFSTTTSLSVISSNTFQLVLGFTNAAPLKTNGLFFSLQLSSHLNGHIQVSTNLTSWTTLTNFVGTNATLHFRDPAATNSSHRYYRAIIP